MKKDYGKNTLTIGKYPVLDIIREGRFAGTPCIKLTSGNLITITNEKLMSVINHEFPLTHTILICGEDDPTLFSNELWSFIKYYRKNSDKERKFHLITDGYKYIPKFLYELDNISVNVKTPSTHQETPPEFISWSHEDEYLKKKTECFFIVDYNVEDVNFARFETTKIGTYRNPISIRQGNGWNSFEEFAGIFVPTLKYPYIRILPNMEKLIEV